MKTLTFMFIALPVFAQSNTWKKIELPDMKLEIPVHADGSLDNSRLQRRTDDPVSARARLTPNNNVLWAVNRSWTEVEEAGYSEWVKTNVREDFLVGSGVKVDCADAAVALRWIYARQEGLPVGQTLAGSGRLFGHWTSTDEWDQLPVALDWRRDERFKAALRYVLDHIYTHSILRDLYPVEIRPAYLTPGTISLIIFGNSGHTRNLMRVAPGYLEFIYGNLPAAESMYQHEDFVFWVPLGEGGFLRFRWPEEVNGQWQLRAGDQMPGYSTEQYDWGEANFDRKLNERLSLWNSIQDQIVGTAAHVARLLSARLSVVYEGYYMCALVPCAPNSPEDIEYSTPQRDHRLAQTVGSLESLIAQVPPGDPVLFDLRAKYAIPILPGSSLTYFDLFSKRVIARIKSDPTLSLFERWGLTDTQDLRAFVTRAHAMSNNFGLRDQLVLQAHLECYPNGVTIPQCDPNAPSIKALDTSRLDQGFRADHVLLRGLLQGLSVADQAQALATLAQWPTHCWARPAGKCTIADLINQDLLERMTSSPLDSISSRYGDP